jgi:hypothetical protein
MEFRSRTCITVWLWIRPEQVPALLERYQLEPFARHSCASAWQQASSAESADGRAPKTSLQSSRRRGSGPTQMAVGPSDDGAIARPVQPRRNKQESACANRKYEYGRQEASLSHIRGLYSCRIEAGRPRQKMVSRSTALKCALMQPLSASGMKSRLHPVLGDNCQYDDCSALIYTPPS